MRDSVREHWLNDKGYRWEYREHVALSDIRIDAGVRQQIRLSDKIDEDHVARLVTALTDGAQLPAVILAQLDTKLELVDGIHRTSAYKHKGAIALDAYVLLNVSNKTQLEQARRMANAPVGKGFSAEEAVQQAVALVSRANWAPKEAAKAMSVNESTVTRRLRILATDERLATIRPKADISALPSMTRDFLGRIQNTDVLGVSLDVILDRKLTGPMVEEIFRDALTISNDAEAERFKQKLATAYPIEARPAFPGIKHTPEWNIDHAVVQLKRALTALDNKSSYFAQLEDTKRKAVAHELQLLGADLLTRATNLSVDGDLAGARRGRRTRQHGRSQAARREIRATGKGGASVS